MTQNELAALQARIYQCWNPPIAERDAGELVVTVRIKLLRDGSLAYQPQMISIGLVSHQLAQVAAESAVRAVIQCSPFGDILEPERYSIWREIDFVFDPRMMNSGGAAAGSARTEDKLVSILAGESFLEALIRAGLPESQALQISTAWNQYYQFQMHEGRELRISGAAPAAVARQYNRS